MRINQKPILIIIFCACIFIDNAYAAPLNYSSDTTLFLTSPAVNFTVTSGSAADALTVNATSVVVALSNTTGGAFTLTSALRDISVGQNGSGGSITQSCASGLATVTIIQSSGSSIYTNTPTGAQCISPSASPIPTPTPSPGSGGGAGGGTALPPDTAPPPQVSNFKAQSSQNQVFLTWQNPSAPDWLRTRIVRKAGSSPQNLTDGQTIYEDSGNFFTDSNLQNGSTYYHAAFTLDRVPNYSQPVIVSVSFQSGVSQFTGSGSVACLLPTGTKEGDLIRGPDGIKVYIVNAFCYKRHIFNPKVFSFYTHFRWDRIKSLDQRSLDSIKSSDYYRAESDPRVFSLEEVDEAEGIARKRWLNVTPQEFMAAGLDWNQIFIINSKERDYYQDGTALSAFDLRIFGESVTVKLSDDPTIYYINSLGYKKAIPNQEVFASYNNKLQDVIIIPRNDLDRYPDVRGIILQGGDGKVYMLENGKKRWVKTP